MRYEEFRDVIRQTLGRHPSGLTWNQLRDRLNLPYGRPCPEWTRRLESQISLTRRPGPARALVWTIGRSRVGGATKR